MNKTVINISKPTGGGNSRHFFSVLMEGHHHESIDVQAVYKSLSFSYKAPFYEIEVVSCETQETVIDMEAA